MGDRAPLKVAWVCFMGGFGTDKMSSFKNESPGQFVTILHKGNLKDPKKVWHYINGSWVDRNLFKIPQVVQFGEFLKIWSLRSSSVTRHVTLKNCGKSQDWKIQMKRTCYFKTVSSSFRSDMNVPILIFWGVGNLVCWLPRSIIWWPQVTALWSFEVE